MRIMLKATLPVETSNETIRSGTISKVIQSILDEQKPEAAYFVAGDGKRCAYVFLDIQDPSQIPAIAEPWFLAFNAHLEITPAMNSQDLAKAGPAIEKAVKKFGSQTKTATAR